MFTCLSHLFNEYSHHVISLFVVPNLFLMLQKFFQIRFSLILVSLKVQVFLVQANASLFLMTFSQCQDLRIHIIIFDTNQQACLIHC
jgi:hypothetical protein